MFLYVFLQEKEVISAEVYHSEMMLIQKLIIAGEYIIGPILSPADAHEAGLQVQRLLCTNLERGHRREEREENI